MISPLTFTIFCVIISIKGCDVKLSFKNVDVPEVDFFTELRKNEQANKVMNLSTYQQEIIDAFDNTNDNLFISALAGTGKTFMLVELSKRITNKSKRAVFIAFNKSIAEELKEKIQNPIFKTFTFNALGYLILLKNAEKEKIEVHLDPFKTNNIVYKMVKEKFKHVDVETRGEFINDFVTLFELCKVKDVDINDTEQIDKMLEYNDLFMTDEIFYEEIYEGIQHIYNENLRLFQEEGIINFSDQIYLTLKKLRANEWFVPPYLKFDYIFGDETQDWNRIQQLLSLFLRKPNARVILVGDQHQAIYAFNGADGFSFRNLKKLYNMKELSLPINYRCASSHLDYVNDVYDYIHILPRPNAPLGTLSTVSLEDMYNKAKIGDFVLSRKNADLCEVSLGFLKKNKPIYIKDTDLVNKVVKLIEKIQKKSKSVDDFIEILDDTIAEYKASLKKEKTKQIEEGEIQTAETEKYDFSNGKVDLLNCVDILIQNYKANSGKYARLKNFVPYVQKMLNTQNPRNCIICTSIHQAKGLEANNVFVLHEGRAFTELGRNKVQQQQEMNLSYVALTRAKENLYLVDGPKSESYYDYDDLDDF